MKTSKETRQALREMAFEIAIKGNMTIQLLNDIDELEKKVEIMRVALERIDQWYYDESPTFEHECTHSDENDKIIGIAENALSELSRMESEAK
jgi:hypothetical protein